MSTSHLIQLVILFFLALLSAFFSSAETALTCSNKVRIHALAEDGSRRAKVLERILQNPAKMLSTILIGNNLVNISATSLATTFTISLFGNAAVGIATGLLTLVILLFGEIIPKTIATLNAEKIALLYSPVIFGLMFLLTPVIFIVDKLSNGILRLLGIDPSKRHTGMTETELKTYVDVSHKEGVIEAEEHEMILNVFDFGDSTASDIMIPRIDMTCVDVNASYEELKKLFEKTFYSRIPVYEGETSNIIGLVNLKDFFTIKSEDKFTIRSILREVYYTYETKKTSDLLMEIRECTHNLVIVVDEYGESVGLITIEDLLEEIVGEIRDEYDQDEKEFLRQIAPRTYKIAGSMKLDDINDALDTHFESEDYDSIGGLMIEFLDRLPASWEKITLEDGTTLQTSKVKGHRIEWVTLTLPEPCVSKTENTDAHPGSSPHIE
ncbi:MAG: HlyC/CorC family transporter [Lachnospiraceae bacterium]|nr:HlyC/CorC family transporter [Lachnospiraceae bacterium]